MHLLLHAFTAERKKKKKTQKNTKTTTTQNAQIKKRRRKFLKNNVNIRVARIMWVCASAHICVCIATLSSMINVLVFIYVSYKILLLNSPEIKLRTSLWLYPVIIQRYVRTMPLLFCQCDIKHNKLLFIGSLLYSSFLLVNWLNTKFFFQWCVTKKSFSISSENVLT